MKLNLISISLIIIVFGVACNNKLPNPAHPPNVLYFQILKDGKLLSDSIVDNMDLFYYDRSTKVSTRLANDTSAFGTLEKFFKRIPEEFPDPANLIEAKVLYSWYVSGYGDSPKQWFFEYPDGDIDTLEVESDKANHMTYYSCNCDNPFTKMKFNGKDVKIHPELKASDKNIYVFEK